MGDNTINVSDILKRHGMLVDNRCAFVFSLFMDKSKFKKYEKSDVTNKKKCNIVCQNVCEYLGYMTRDNTFNKDTGSDVVNCTINIPTDNNIRHGDLYKVVKVNNIIYISDNKDVNDLRDLCYIKPFQYIKHDDNIKSTYGITSDIDLLLFAISTISYISIDNVYLYVKQFIRTFSPSKDQLLLAISIYFIMSVHRDISKSKRQYPKFAITSDGVKNIYNDEDDNERMEKDASDTENAAGANDIVIAESIDDIIEDDYVEYNSTNNTSRSF